MTKTDKTEEFSVYSSHADEILKLVRSNISPVVLQEQLEDFHENDIADVLPMLTPQERKKLCRVMRPESLSTVFSYVDEVAPFLEELDIRKALSIVSLMEPDDAVDALRQLDKGKREVLVDLMDPETRKDLRLIASFDEDEIGGQMTTDFIEVPLSFTVREAMFSLANQARETENISTIYVLQQDNSFYGAIPLRDLIIADPDMPLEPLCQTSFPYVYGHEDVSDCIETLKDYSEDSIPVLDHQNRVLGIVTAQTMMEISDEEMGEDYARLAGLTAENDLKESVIASSKKRLPWLVILLGLGLLVSTVVGLFEGVVASLPLIICFQSLILDMAGNAGTQSLAVTIRILTDESISPKQRLRLVPRETKVGLLNGFLLGSVSFLIIGLYLWLLKAQPVSLAFSISGCIGVALVCAMMISALFGTLIPLFFKKIKMDPAVASGPLITTINDLVAVVCYYGLAWLLLIETLHLV